MLALVSVEGSDEEEEGRVGEAPLEGDILLFVWRCVR